MEHNIVYDYNLSHLTWFKVGGPAEIFFKPRTQEELIHFLQSFKEGAYENITHNRSIFVLGCGSNTVIRDKGIGGAVISLAKVFNGVEINEQDSTITAGSGCLNHTLANFALNHEISGFEFLVGIPGSVGGGVAMNAGCYGVEYSDIVDKVHGIDYEGNNYQFTNVEMGFTYRANKLSQSNTFDDIIFTKVAFKGSKSSYQSIKHSMNAIKENRAQSQPLPPVRTAGSTFRNPSLERKAWEIIDAAGLRGLNIGGASISQKHANFIVCEQGATASDIEELIKKVQESVFEFCSVMLEPEIKVIGII